MIELLPVACGSFLAGWILGRALSLRLRGRWWPQRDPFARWWRRSPYSCSAIWMAATQEDAEKLKCRLIDPSVGEPWPEPMTVDDWACDRRPGSNPPPPGGKPQPPPSGPPQPLAADLIRSGEPTLPKVDIIRRPQPSSPRFIPRDTP